MRPPGPWEIGIIVLIILIVFGAGKLPQVGEAFSKGIRAFKLGKGGEAEQEETPRKKKTSRKANQEVNSGKI